MNRFGIFALLLGLGWVFQTCASSVVDDPDKPAPPPKSAPKVVRISEPHTHSNLSIFLLHGESNLKERKFISLGEAMEQKKIIVYETSTVNTLLVENVSEDCEVFIQSGDIVKGGRQDRLMATDLIVPAKSGGMPIPSFCVESGRWASRGQEDVAQFSGNSFQGSKDVKLAANQARSQQEVWNKVQQTQSLLSKTVNKNVASAESPSSYQLTMEDKELAAKLAEYETDLTNILNQHNDVVGIAYAINGKLEGAEVYGNSPLLKTQWNKVLNSCATDALAALDSSKTFDPVSTTAVESFLAQFVGTMKEVKQGQDHSARQGIGLGQSRQNYQVEQNFRVPNVQPPIPQTNQEQSNSNSVPPSQSPISAVPTIRIYQSDTPTTLLIESRDMDGAGNVVHRSYLRKEK
jgi:hypothetical protein